MSKSIKDVAKVAGVSVTTVSRVLNNRGPISEKTREKVFKAMESINYTPNEFARALKLNKTHFIGVSVPSIWHPFFSEFVFHIENRLSRLKYNVLICSNNNDKTREIEFLNMVKQNKVDGIIAITYSDIDRYVSARLPFVSVDRFFTEQVAYVTSDNYWGGKIAASELIKRGCKKIAYIASVARQPNDTLKRKDGFVDGAKEKNCEFVVYEKKEPINDYAMFFSEFFSKYHHIDGIFVVNDQTTLLLLRELNKMGIRVPEDVQIIGYDAFQYFENFDTTLSSIKQPIKEMAESSVDMLLKIIDKEQIPNPVVLPVAFKEGRTTKSLPIYQY
ncbi:LacI family DNA-binding transcriptional regulator [Sporolactobacillus nakayamae]|uniref:Transcriptional regulator, LacI family n=1 Tax=Sporolactobacillus nakayamae TaxID=269670 RepID=A0A1I2PVS2_9BACL|nr:LacI family DNA-binding transcriptional regulator [Sporolactobacillus nakayamae]SFG18107.1 transcriptional regulator, LacI family [Sporolactobacillus nakayamae]